MTEFKELPARWSVAVNGQHHELTLQQIFDLRAACDQVLEHRSKSVNEVIDLVCQKMDVERYQVLSRGRMEWQSIARFCIWHILRKRGLSKNEIARQFHRHFGSITSGLLCIKKKMQEPEWKERLEWLNRTN